MNLEETNKSEPTYEEFVNFINSLNKNYKYLGTIIPSDEAREEVNKLIEEGNKPVKNHSHTETLKLLRMEMWEIGKSKGKNYE